MLPDFRVRQRDYLLEIAQSLSMELDMEKLLSRILNISIEMVAGQAGLIVLRDRPGGWRVTTAQAIPSPFLRYLESWLSQVEIHEDPEKFELPEISRLLKELARSATLGLLTGVGLPLVARKQVIGVIFVFRSYPDVFSSNDRALLSSFANQAAIAVRNAQLYRQARQEKQRADALLDSAGDGILILSKDHRIERANPAFLRLYGAEQADITGWYHSDIIRWSGQPQGTQLEVAAAGGWPLTPHAHLYVEGDLIRPKQVNLPIGITYAPLLSPDNSLLNVIATVRDITRFRQAEELKTTFISVVSHELKTPVALIKGYVGTLRREDASWDSKTVQDSLQVIEEEADRLTDLIENLLDASRLQAGAFSLKKSDLYLPDLARRLAERFQTQTDQHKIVADVPDDMPTVMADENRITQVLSNLISNGIKYSSGEEVRISGQARPEQVIMCVSDQGQGIAPEDIPHVFDRFYRGPDAARNTKGAGLGLYLARAIVEAHGGRIWVDPSPKAGTRICFSLPRS